MEAVGTDRQRRLADGRHFRVGGRVARGTDDVVLAGEHIPVEDNDGAVWHLPGPNSFTRLGDREGEIIS